ncbi:alpha/beta hydrolase [Sphingomonas faeni]|uniref:alpha/beta hydrolase n=1 Tax=Sphingomonas faeni TaxID=185950 RepID=UPI0024137694|nr:alpha/beta hydrolase [Sphingomonas faeni]
MTGQTPEQRHAIATMARVLGPDTLTAVQRLYRADQEERAALTRRVAVDQAYGEHSRQRLDVYAPGSGPSDESAAARPVLLWVHGGGFVRGEKASPDHPFNAHVGHWVARLGLIGVVMNYRLLPEAAWPSGGDDVAAAVNWIGRHITDWGGDPARIVVAGTSAGATHVATYLQNATLPASVRGAILLSGLYGGVPLEPRDTAYLGVDARITPFGIASCGLPMFLACAEFDPVRFQDDTMTLAAAVRTQRGDWPLMAVVGGHNHFSLACHLGGTDNSLAELLRPFLYEICLTPIGDVS